MSQSLRLHCSLLFAAFTLALVTVARAEEAVTAIKFSDPSKPGTLKITVGHGDVQIKGGDAAEVSVKSEVKAATKKPRKDGLRVLASASTFSLNEKDNVITLDALSEGWSGTPSDFRLTVPRNTNIVVASSFGGDITCTGVSGDLEIKNMSGEIRLDDVTGSALVETMNGEIRAVIRELHDGKPLSFTSMNGEVILRVPTDAKASVRIRTQNGEILSDFDEQALVTKTENTPRAAKRAFRVSAPRSSGSSEIITPEVKDAIREAARAGAEVVREASKAMREAAQAARDGAHEVTPDSPMPRSPFPPLPPIPPVTGGKLLTGALNGGGPEISVATMNGDVTLRQIEAKK